MMPRHLKPLLNVISYQCVKFETKEYKRGGGRKMAWRTLSVECATITATTDIFPQSEKQISR